MELSGTNGAEDFILNDASYRVLPDDLGYTVSVSGTNPELRVPYGPMTASLEIARKLKDNNMVILEVPNPVEWAKRNCENLEDVIEETIPDIRYRVNSNVLTRGGSSSEPAYQRSSLSMAQNTYLSETSPFGVYAGLNKYSVIVAPDRNSLKTFIEKHLPFYTKGGDPERHIVFVVPVGGENIAAEALRVSRLDKKLKVAQAGHETSSASMDSALLKTAKSIKTRNDETEKANVSRVSEERLRRKEKVYFEVPVPDERKSDPGWAKNPLVERAEITKALMKEMKLGRIPKSELIERAKIITQAADRMRVCPFKPRGVGWNMADGVGSEFMNAYDYKIKIAAMDILTEIWKKAPPVVRSMIQNAADMPGIRYQKHNSEMMWKKLVRVRGDMMDYRDYLLKNGKERPPDHDPDYIAELVYFAFPELTGRGGMSYSMTLLELRRATGEDGYSPDRKAYQKRILERAVKIFPGDKKLRENLEESRNEVEKRNRRRGR